jgi:hypothetical protein
MALRLINSQVEAHMYGRDKETGQPYVFCEMSKATRKPCDKRITLDGNHQPITGLMVHAPYSRVIGIYCSGKCLVRDMK